MPRLDDPEELEIIKKIHGFEPAFVNDGLEEDERNERWEKKKKNIKNQAR